MLSNSTGVLLRFGFGLLLASTTSATTYNFTTIDVPGSPVTIPFAINDSGAIVGSYGCGFAPTKGINGCEHAFLRVGSAVTTIDFPGSCSSEAFGINNNGDIVGHFRACDNCAQASPCSDHAFLRTSSGSFQVIDHNGDLDACQGPHTALNTDAFGINSAGDTTGDLFACCECGGGSSWAYLGVGGSLALDGFPFPEPIPCGCPGPFPQNSCGNPLPGCSVSLVGTDINDSGQIVGNDRYFFGSFLRTSSGFSAVWDAPLLYPTFFNGINSQGDIVGSRQANAFRLSGYTITGPDPATGVGVLTGGTLSIIDFCGETAPQYAFGINRLGQIVGTSACSSGNHAWLATPVRVRRPIQPQIAE